MTTIQFQLPDEVLLSLKETPSHCPQLSPAKSVVALL
jgi:hypothetical protein